MVVCFGFGKQQQKIVEKGRNRRAMAAIGFIEKGDERGFGRSGQRGLAQHLEQVFRWCFCFIEKRFPFACQLRWVIFLHHRYPAGKPESFWWSERVHPQCNTCSAQIGNC
jgi:hypothetical protein